MATPSAMAFHNESLRMSRNRVMNTLKYNEGANQRRIDPTYKGMVKNSTGSMNMPFGNVNDSGKPFDPMPGAVSQMRGGIRNNVNYPKVKQLLKQRATDMEIQDNPAVIPVMKMESLTEEDKYKIRLNALLIRLDDLMETGELTSTDDIFSNVLILVANVAPTMGQYELNELLSYWNNILLNSSFNIFVKGNAKEQLKTANFTRHTIAREIRKFVMEMIVNVNRPLNEKMLLARAFIRSSGFSSLATRVLKEARIYADDYVASMREPLIRELAELRGDEEDEDGFDGPEDMGAMEEQAVNEAEEDIYGDAEEAMPARIRPPVGPPTTPEQRQLSFLYNRSPAGPRSASDELMELFQIHSPRNTKLKSRTQVMNILAPLLQSQLPRYARLRQRLAVLAPDVN